MKVAVLNAVLSCFMCRRTRTQNSTLPRTFLVGEYANRANRPTGNSERPVHNFHQILAFSFSIKNRLELWQIILHPVWCRLERLAATLQLFTTKGTGVDSNRVEMPNGTGNFRNFQISRKKDNLRRLFTIFETNFQKRSVPFHFVPEFPEILVKWIAPF